MTKPILALLIISVFSMFCAKKEPTPAAEPTPEVTEVVVLETPAAVETPAPVPTAVGPAECAEGTREVSVASAGKKPECRECRGGKWHKCKS